jgi:3',5'-nucleoside bisphosphate phosphatase
MAVDLHIHSTASDGSHTPEEIVEIAVRNGLSAIAIADHDTVAGVAAGLRATAGRLTLLPAVEISASHGHDELHLLGYMVDVDAAPLLAVLEHIQEEREKRARRTVEVLQGLGVDLAYEQVAAVARGASIGRPHIATALVEAGAVPTPAMAFERYLKRGRPAYVDRYRVTPQEAIALIREAEGLPVLAHPKLIHRDALIPELASQGLGGLEAFHTQHSPNDVEHYLALAARLHLVVTGGTDSHGPGGSYPVEIGAVEVPDACAADVLAWKTRQG